MEDTNNGQSVEGINFVIGDIVELRSGGPVMTVNTSNNSPECVWFVVGGELKRAVFNQGSLQASGTPPPPPLPA